MYNGIDVSKWQGKINWSKAKKYIDFAIIRAGYGKGNVDEYANYYIEQCEKYKTKNITLTGGEPLIHLDVDYLLRALSEKGFNVNVETNGSVSIKKYFSQFYCENHNFLKSSIYL